MDQELKQNQHSRYGFSVMGAQCENAWQPGDVVGCVGWDIDRAYVIMGSTPIWGHSGGSYYALKVKDYKAGRGGDAVREECFAEKHGYTLLGNINDL